MARPRKFDEGEVVALAAAVFGRLGYNASSIDDLLTATGLQRGSLYKAFGSKRNLFEKVLLGALVSGWTKRRESLDLVIIALKELAPVDPPIAKLCRTVLATTPGDIPRMLGNRLLENIKA
jgi:TetR/AcrR family transcriptional regulator, transcriptional repressor for nem operon